MAAGFDPYHRWLSIPPAEQPPDHYRLLGLQVFETSYAVIENAAARQSRHVRGHLETPLRPYATNLLREIEIARLCLLDREAKAAYDSCLRQRQEYQAPSKTRKASPERSRGESVPSVPSSTSAPTYPSEAPRSIAATPVPAIHTYRSHHRKRRRGSPITFLVLWLAGGAMGLLAGYAILCMIDPEYDFLHVMFPEERPRHPEIAIASVLPTVGTLERSQRPRPERSSQSQPIQSPISPAVPKEAAELERSRTAGDEFDIELETELPGGQLPKNQQRAAQNLQPVVLPFDFKKRVLRVVSMPELESYEDIRCNIEASAGLGMNPLIDFPLGAKQNVVFNIGVNGITAGIEVSFQRRNKAVIVEITPKYVLPSGDEEAWQKNAGIRKAKLLAKQVGVATEARNALPGLKRELDRVISEIDSTSQIVNSPSTPSTYSKQLTASRRLQELEPQRKAVQKQFNVAGSLSKNLQMLEADMAAVQQLGEWSGKIADSETLAVCIHCNGASLEAQAR